MKSKVYVVTALLLIYILFYKLILIFNGELFQYIINPLIWLFFCIICYLELYKNNHPNYKNKKDVIYTVIIGSLLYMIIFYSIGYFVGFSNNPYSVTLSGLLVNFFSIILVIILKEFIRSILVNINNTFYIILLILIFIISDINLSLILNVKLSINNLFILIGKYIIPNLSINIFCTYLVRKGGYYSSSIYRIIIFIPSIILPILPKYEWIVQTLFDALMPLFIYIFIEYRIRKKNKLLVSSSEEIKPSRWSVTFIITILIIIFTLGGFRIKPIVILTESMKPYIYPGDLLLIEKCEIKNVVVGDIIQFNISDYSVVHRVVKTINNKDEIKLITKGDNNISGDKGFITKDNLVGCFKYKIPYIGYPTYLINIVFSNNNVEVETGG